MRRLLGLSLSVGFGIVIALIALLGFGAMRRARTINDEMIAAHEKYLQTEAVLNEIPAALYLADILVRDYLLDPSQSAAPAYRQQLARYPFFSPDTSRCSGQLRYRGQSCGAGIAEGSSRLLGVGSTGVRLESAGESRAQLCFSETAGSAAPERGGGSGTGGEPPQCPQSPNENSGACGNDRQLCSRF